MNTTRDTMPPITDRTPVRLSLAQLWAVIGSVAFGTSVLAGGIYSIKAEQAATRADIASGRDRVEERMSTTLTAIREIKDSRAESLREWTQWRARVDESNTRQDTELTNQRSLIQNWHRIP